MLTHVNTIERNIETVNVWLKELTSELPDVDRDDAWTRLSAVLQTVRDRVPPDEAAEFAAQLPEIVRGAYYGSWNPSDTPQKWRHRNEYLQAVNDKLGPREPVDAEQTVRAVLKVLSRHMDSGALQKIKETHPKEVWDLWPQ
jgi:uncharacterized protein (DUF2267 family)